MRWHLDEQKRARLQPLHRSLPGWSHTRHGSTEVDGEEALILERRRVSE